MEEPTIETQYEVERAEAHNALIGRIEAQEVTVDRSGVGVIAAGKDISVDRGGAAAMLAGRDMKLDYGGSQIMMAGRDMDVQYGGGGLMMCNQARVEDSTIGLLISQDATLGGETKVLFNTPQAIAFGAAFGAVFALISFLLRSLKR